VPEPDSSERHSDVRNAGTAVPALREISAMNRLVRRGRHDAMVRIGQPCAEPVCRSRLGDGVRISAAMAETGSARRAIPSRLQCTEAREGDDGALCAAEIRSTGAPEPHPRIVRRASRRHRREDRWRTRQVRSLLSIESATTASAMEIRSTGAAAGLHHASSPDSCRRRTGSLMATRQLRIWLLRIEETTARGGIMSRSAQRRK